jgi:hypothetical protein
MQTSSIVSFTVPDDIVDALVQQVKSDFNIPDTAIHIRKLSDPNNRIFINYRHLDSEDICGRIYDRLVQEFGKGRVFRDVESIDDGANIRQTVERELAACRVMLVLMGPKWADEEHKERLNRYDDLVRIEIETALQRQRNSEMKVIPLWTGRRASYPPIQDIPKTIHELFDQNARSIGAREFHQDMEKLITQIRKEFGEQD